MKKLLVFISLGMLLFACSGDNNMDDFKTKPTAETKISPGEILNIAFAGATHTIAIETTGNWKIGNIPDWCSFNQTSGKGNASVKLTVAPNNATSTREAVVKINNQTLTLKQSAKPTEQKLKDQTRIGYIDITYSPDFELIWGEEYKLNKTKDQYLKFEDESDYYYITSMYACQSTTQYEKYLSISFVYDFKTDKGIYTSDIQKNMPNLLRLRVHTNNSLSNVTSEVFYCEKVDENTYIYTFEDYMLSENAKVNGKIKLKMY